MNQPRDAAVKRPLPLWRLTAAVAAAALVGAGLAWFPLLLIPFTVPVTGCGLVGLGFMILIGMTLFFLVLWVVLAALVIAGGVLSHNGKGWAPYFVVAANLVLIDYLAYLHPVDTGQLVWGWIVIAFTFLPIAAILLAAAQLVLRGVSGHVVGAFVALLAIGLLIPTMSMGWVYDLRYAYESLPPAVSTSSTHC